jgi:hypothetical protein
LESTSASAIDHQDSAVVLDDVPASPGSLHERRNHDPAERVVAANLLDEVADAENFRLLHPVPLS